MLGNSNIYSRFY